MAAEKINLSENDIIGIMDSIFKQTTAELTIGGEVVSEYEYLNIHWYAKKLRLAPSRNYLEAMREKEGSLYSAYCLCEITGDMHLQNKTLDFATLDVSFTGIFQTDKLNVLEDLLVRTNLTLVGDKFPIEVVRKDKDGNVLATQKRNGNIRVSRPQVQEVKSESGLGETALVSFSVSFTVFDELFVYDDYKISISADDVDYYAVPFSMFKFNFDTVQRALPNTNLAETGVLNNTSSLTFFFTVYDKPDDLGKLLERILLFHQIYEREPPVDKGTAPNNNDVYYFRVVSPNNVIYEYRCVVMNASRDITSDMTPTQTAVTLKPMAVI